MGSHIQSLPSRFHALKSSQKGDTGYRSTEQLHSLKLRAQALESVPKRHAVGSVVDTNALPGEEAIDEVGNTTKADARPEESKVADHGVLHTMVLKKAEGVKNTTKADARPEESKVADQGVLHTMVLKKAEGVKNLAAMDAECQKA